MADRTVAGWQTKCRRLESAIDRNARAANRGAEWATRLAALEAPADDWTAEQWETRRLHLFGLLSRVLESAIERQADRDGHDVTRLRALMQAPEPVLLSSGRTIQCHPVTLPVAEAIAKRQAILLAAVAAEQHLQLRAPQGQYALLGRLRRERLWQRVALLYEATQGRGGLLRLPTDHAWYVAPLLRLWDTIDGGNRWDLEAWRTRAIAGWCWRVLDRVLPGALLTRLTGIPPAWCWTCTPLDELAIMRGNLAANDERAAALPRLRQAGEPSNWGWTGFATAMAEARNTLAAEFIRDTGLVAILTDYSMSAVRAAERDKKADKAKAAAPAKGRRGKRRR